MAIVKSELIKELKKSYPNFLTRDLNKVVEIILKEIKETLNRGESVELRGFGTWRTKIQKPRLDAIRGQLKKLTFQKKEISNGKCQKTCLKS